MHRHTRILIVLAVGCGGNDGGSTVDAPTGPDANPDAPTCTIDMPATGAEIAFDASVMLVATATDLQDGTLSGASVVWRSDRQVAPLGSGTTLSTMLPLGLNAVTCTATDSTSLTGSSAPVAITAKSPFATINHPGDGETRPVNQQVPFTGVGRDLEDGPLTGAALVWTSSIDGALGTGEMFNRSLTAGVHTITLTATDSNSNTDTDTITLTLTMP